MSTFSPVLTPFGPGRLMHPSNAAIKANPGDCEQLLPKCAANDDLSASLLRSKINRRNAMGLMAIWALSCHGIACNYDGRDSHASDGYLVPCLLRIHFVHVAITFSSKISFTIRFKTNYADEAYSALYPVCYSPWRKAHKNKNRSLMRECESQTGKVMAAKFVRAANVERE